MKRIQPATAAAQPVYGPLKSGDDVIVQTRDGERWRFKIDAIEGDTIVAPGGRRFVAKDVMRVERRQFSGPKTVALVAGIAGGVFVVVQAMVAAALDSLLSGG